jgi:hypothetical protein
MTSTSVVRTGLGVAATGGTMRAPTQADSPAHEPHQPPTELKRAVARHAQGAVR